MRPRPGLRRLARSVPFLFVTVLAAGSALSACAGGAGTAAPAGTTASGATASPSSTGGAGSPPVIVAVTTTGALVTLNPASGVVTRKLVPAGVLGGEISVSATGMVYFARENGCSSKIEATPLSGGSAAVIASGSVPDVSPNGSKLAYADQPSLTAGCAPRTPDLVPLYHLDIRTLRSGSTVSFPMVPARQDSSLPAPISHLSWASDNDHLAVSTSAVEDNEGFDLVLVDTSQARYYLTGAGTSLVPVTGKPAAQDSYLREGVFMPDGNLFVSRACCAGVPVRNISRLMWEVTTSGAFVHQVAIGYPNLDHTSLDVSAAGDWLLYLAGNALYVSAGGATPRELTSGLAAAAWG